MIFAENLKTICKMYDIEIADIAGIMGISEVEIKKVVSWGQEPDPRTAEKICEFFGVNKEYMTSQKINTL